MANNSNLSILDALNLMSIALQLETYQNGKETISNDDILKELQTQDNKFLQKILENQNKIISLLEQTNDNKK